MAGLFLGIDVGTGGVRVCAIGAHGNLQGFASAALPASRQQRRLSARRSSSSCSRSSRSSRRIKASTHIGLGEPASGASKTGGAALLLHFTAEQLERLTARLKPEQPAGLDYYPLLKQGLRFPISDPSRAARIAPPPAKDARFFPGLLEGIASVAAVPNRRPALPGAPPIRRVISIGGGGKNSAWVAIRRPIPGVPVTIAEQTEASYGRALPALHGGPP